MSSSRWQVLERVDHPSGSFVEREIGQVIADTHARAKDLARQKFRAIDWGKTSVRLVLPREGRREWYRQIDVSDGSVPADKDEAL